MAIASLDFSAYSRGDKQQREEFCQNLCKSLSVYGFAKLRNHNISNERVKEVFQWNRQFFALPEEIKAKAAHPQQPMPHRGYSHVGQEIVSTISGFEKGRQQDTVVRDIRESFDQGSSDDDVWPNRWVDEEDLVGFRKFMEDFYDSCTELHMDVLEAITTGLKLPQRTLVDLCQNGISELRLIHYPKTTCRSLAPGTYRISEHSDFGCITLLFQDSVGGLEIEDQTKDGTFVPLEPDDPFEIIMNVGDCLQRWTDETLRSANHRVTLPKGIDHRSEGWVADRYTVAYFGKPNRRSVVDTLPAFRKEGVLPKYDSHMTTWDYNVSKLNRTYA